MRLFGIVLAASCLAAGCEPPTLSVEHDLPAALPLNGALRVQAAQAEGDAPAMLAGEFTDRLKQAIDDANTGPAESHSGTIDIRPRLRVTVDDTRTERTVRRLDDSGELVTETLPSLHRTVTMEGEFELTRLGDKVLTIELRRDYNSLADARVRGPLGLKRPDDPESVPTVAVICDELAGPMARTFAELFEPLKVTARIELRPAGTQAGRDGLDAARRGNFEQALAAFETAVREAPESAAAHFNLAATAEALNRLELAHDHYERVNELTEEKDSDAADAARRVRNVLTHREAARSFHDKVGR